MAKRMSSASVLFLAILAILMSCEPYDENDSGEFADEISEERASDDGVTYDETTEGTEPDEGRQLDLGEHVVTGHHAHTGLGLDDPDHAALVIEPQALADVTYHLVGARAIYHAPCQLLGHGIGAPAEPVLRQIPGLELHRSECTCCGVAGTYGVKAEKYQVAVDVGRGLFEQAQTIGADFIITDSETCRWWISRHTGLPAYHPIEILSRAMDVR